MRLPLALLAVMVATPAAAQLPPLPEPTYPQPRYAAPVPLPRTVQPVPLPSAVQPVPLPYARPGNDIGTGQSLPLSPNASNITPDDSRSTIAPTLPIPQIGEDAPPAAFLRAARAALQAGRTGEAQEGLERAESRTLTRSTRPSLADHPARSPFLLLLSEARGALAQGDRNAAIHFIDRALADPEARIPAF